METIGRFEGLDIGWQIQLIATFANNACDWHNGWVLRTQAVVLPIVQVEVLLICEDL